jgi:hypothetical protein
MNKRKEAQKLASWALSKITQLTSAKSTKSSKSSKSAVTDDIAAIEAAFGNLDAKLN